MRRIYFSDAGWKFRSVSGAKDPVQKQKRGRAQQFALESLESRCLLSTIAEYPTPKLSNGDVAQPAEIISTDGKLWFTESGGAIGMVDPANPGTIVSYSNGLSTNAGPTGITVGSDGNVWFSETAGAIGMLSTSNPTTPIQNYSQGLLANAHPFGIASVPGGNIWFTDVHNNAIGWINPSSPNMITEIQVPSSLEGIQNFGSQIIAGPGGSLYFTESSAIGIFDPSAASGKQFSQVLLPSGQEPFGIAVGPDNQSIWYTWENLSGSPSSGIGTFNTLSPPSTIPAGSSFQIPTPSGGVTPQPNQITSGLDGELYFTDTGNGAIYSINPSSDVISQPDLIGKTVISNPLPNGITTGPDGDLWFTDDGQQVATPSISGAVGVVDRLAIAAQPPASVTAGAGFGFTVYVETAGGVRDTSYNGNVTVALASNPGGSTLGGTLTVAADKGVASFGAAPNNELTLTKAATGYTLAVSGSGLTGATSSAITVTPAAASQLVIQNQPSATATAGKAFGTQPVIDELDQYGNLETGDNSTVVTAVLNSGVGPLQGTTATVSGGVATFAGLADKKAETLTLKFTSGGLTSLPTSSIVVSPGSPTQLVLTQKPSATATAGQAFATQPVVHEEDQYGNLETGDNSTVVTAALNSGVGPLEGTTAIVSGGVATFTGLAANTAETLTLKFTSGGLTEPISSNIVVSPAAASQLVIEQQPPTFVTAGSGFSVAVTFKDQFGNATTFNGKINVALSASPSIILQTVTVTSGSIAQFSGLKVDNAGKYSLLFTASSLSPATSNAFTVVPVSVAPPAPQILDASVVTSQKTNKKGKPIGKPVLNGYQFTFNMPMNSSITNVNDYQVDTIVQVTVKIGKKRTKILEPQPIGFSLALTSNNTVKVLLAGKQAFKYGGQITLIATPPSGISSAAGAPLSGNAVYNIAKGGFGITLA